MGIPAALARCRSTSICTPSVIANMSGMDVGDAASFAPTAAATPMSAMRVSSRPPQPAPIVVQEARSQVRRLARRQLIVFSRITPKPMDASPLRVSSAAEATVSERCFDVSVEEDEAVDAQCDRKEHRALPEPIASPLAHDEEGDHREAAENIDRVLLDSGHDA